MTILKCVFVAGTLIAVMMGLSGSAVAGTDEEQLARMKDPDQWPAPGPRFLSSRATASSRISTPETSTSCR